MTASRSLIAAARGRRESTRGGGFTLIEVLIALVVMSVGLLGLASLQTNTLAFNRDAYLRSQATALAYDIIDRMRANRDAAVNGGAYDVPAMANPAPVCNAAVPTTPVATADIAGWRRALACALPGGNGSIDTNGPEVTVTVQWADTTRGANGALESFTVTTRL